MKFKKGQSGNPSGRKPGTETKHKKQARELFILIMEGEVEHIEAALSEIRRKSPYNYLQCISKLLPYFMPKQFDITSKGEEVKQVFRVGGVEVEL